MNKAKLTGIAIMMIFIASVSTISAEVYSTELNGKDQERINTCKANIENTIAPLTGEDLKRANKILYGIVKS